MTTNQPPPDHAEAKAITWTTVEQRDPVTHRYKLRVLVPEGPDNSWGYYRDATPEDLARLPTEAIEAAGLFRCREDILSTRNRRTAELEQQVAALQASEADLCQKVNALAVRYDTLESDHHQLAEKVRVMVHAFDAGDSRRRAVLALADEIQAELARLAAQSESWRKAHSAWQDWATELLAALGRHPLGGQHGDGPAREIIATLAGLAPGVPRCSRCGCFATRHEVDDEELRACADCECAQYETP
jgi:hypothetical protein